MASCSVTPWQISRAVRAGLLVSTDYILPSCRHRQFLGDRTKTAKRTCTGPSLAEAQTPERYEFEVHRRIGTSPVQPGKRWLDLRRISFVWARSGGPMESGSGGPMESSRTPWKNSFNLFTKSVTFFGLRIEFDPLLGTSLSSLQILLESLHELSSWVSFFYFLSGFTNSIRIVRQIGSAVGSAPRLLGHPRCN